MSNAVTKSLIEAVSELKTGFKALSANLAELKKPVREPAANPAHLFAAISGPIPKDSQTYSMFNIVKGYQTGNWENAKLEREIHNQLVAAGYAKEGGTLVPYDVPDCQRYSEKLKAMGLSEIMALRGDQLDPTNLRHIAKRLGSSAQKSLSAFGLDTAGGALVDTKLAGSILELLRAQVVTVKAGATEIQLPPSGMLSWARQTSDPTFSWIGENSSIAPTDPAFGNILFSAKKAAALVIISNDALLYTNPAIETITRLALAEKGARFEDATFLEGNGSNYSPMGIINHSGITTHTANFTPGDGNTGYVFQPEDVENMVAKVFEANDPVGPTAWIMRPLQWAGIKNRRADSVTAGDGKGPFVFLTSRGDYSAGLAPTLSDLPVLVSTTCSNTRTRGSAANLGYVLTGNFKRAVIARTGAMEIAALSSGAEFKADQTAVRAIFRLDFQLTHTKPFVLCDALQII